MSVLGGYLLKSSTFMHVFYLYPARCGLTLNLWLGSLRSQKNIKLLAWITSQNLTKWRNGICFRSLLCGSENFSTYFYFVYIVLFWIDSACYSAVLFPARFNSNSQGDNCNDLCIMCTYYIGAWPSETCVLNMSRVEINKPNVQSENAIK